MPDLLEIGEARNEQMKALIAADKPPKKKYALAAFFLTTRRILHVSNKCIIDPAREVFELLGATQTKPVVAQRIELDAYAFFVTEARTKASSVVVIRLPTSDFTY